MKWKNLRTKKSEKEELTDNFGRFVSETFERGYACHRKRDKRILLSSFPAPLRTAV
jgi:hypothetical protein